jgi:hypothetical protein
MVKLLRLRPASTAEKVVGELIEGMAKPVGGDDEP